MINYIDLTDKDWDFHLSKDKPDINVQFSDTIPLPSTVSQRKKSPVTDERSDGYLTDPHRFDGCALYRRTFTLAKDNCDYILTLERTRTTSVWINGTFAGTQNSLCAPHKYNITDLVRDGENAIIIMVDNVSCPVPGGHMTSPDTQTNWLGITGKIGIERLAKLRADNIKIYPDSHNSRVTVTGMTTGKCTLTAVVDGFPAQNITADGSFSFTYEMPAAKLWSEHSPVVYTMKICCGDDTVETRFGMRNFAIRGTDFLLNGEKIFLRGKHDGMIFPITASAPTDKEGWLKVMSAAKEHGINHYRFHTCCPPEAAFDAADELGICMEPELPFWGTVDDKITAGQQYLIDEGFRILDCFGNHPSFFAMSLGNELWGSKERLNDILGGYKKHDPRHLYTQGSNNFQFWPCIVENDDFFVGVRFSKERLFRGSYAMCDAPLGHIQTAAPNADYTYDKHIRPDTVSGEKSGGGTIEIQYGTGVKTVSVDSGGEQFISNIPVVSHEVGQYFMYPDYTEIEKYTGVLKPYNLEIFRERLQAAGLSHLADKYFRASGRFAAECYKAEIETALRSKELSGFQLLDIQDFTGQGTALVGILNAFMESKGVISPAEWRQFCSDRVILGCLHKFVFASGEETEIPVKLYYYGADAVTDPKVKITISCGDRVQEYMVSAKGSYKGGVFDIGSVTVTMPAVSRSTKCKIQLTCGDISNSYDVWVFSSSAPADFVTDWGDAKTRLARGESVLFIPEKISAERSVEGTYCTDFWNYPMFSSISESMNKPLPVGTLGLLVDTDHPALKNFPTESYSTPQWYDTVTDSRTLILDGTGIEPIVRTIDNCKRNHSLGTIFEVQTGGGKLLVCTAHLDKKQTSVSCAKLLECLSEYVRSVEFAPKASIDMTELNKFFSE